MIDCAMLEKSTLSQQSSVLDLAFVMDCTGSMGSYISNATKSIRKIVEEIVKLEKSDVQLALIEYRDHEPQETTFVTRVHDFTSSVNNMSKWLENCSAQGGGDEPEAVADGLNDALNLNWREEATKICILISDAPPHGIGSSDDTMPNGCPKGIDPIKVVEKLAKKGVTLYTVGCEPSLLPYKDFFSAIAFKTGGQYVPLRNAQLLSKVIVSGAVEEISLERLMADVELEMNNQSQQGVNDEKALAEAVQAKLCSKGVKTNHIVLNESKLEGPSEKARMYSKLSDFAEFKAHFNPNIPSNSQIQTFGILNPYRALSDESDSSFEIMPAPQTESSSESYGITNETIDFCQAERLVQKVLNRKIKDF